MQRLQLFPCVSAALLNLLCRAESPAAYCMCQRVLMCSDLNTMGGWCWYSTHKVMSTAPLSSLVPVREIVREGSTFSV